MLATWDEIRTFGLSVPHTSETASQGTPAVGVHDHIFMRYRPDDDTVVIACTLSEKRALLESHDPAMSTITHDDQHTVLLRLEHAELDNEVEEIITEAWRIAETQAKAMALLAAIGEDRERLIAIITNNFSICNGRWPTLILMGTIFVGDTLPLVASVRPEVGASVDIWGGGGCKLHYGDALAGKQRSTASNKRLRTKRPLADAATLAAQAPGADDLVTVDVCQHRSPVVVQRIPIVGGAVPVGVAQERDAALELRQLGNLHAVRREEDARHARRFATRVRLELVRAAVGKQGAGPRLERQLLRRPERIRNDRSRRPDDARPARRQRSLALHMRIALRNLRLRWRHGNDASVDRLHIRGLRGERIDLLAALTDRVHHHA